MDFFTNIFTYITDGTKKISHKAATIISFIFILFLIDNTLGFSYYANIDNKLEVVEKVNLILKDSSLLKNDVSSLTKLRTKTINRMSIKDKLWTTLTSVASEDRKGGNNVTDSVVLNFISSCWSLILIILISPTVAYEGKTWFRRITIWILVVSICGIVALILNMLLWLIPQFGGNIIYNHIINFIVNFGIVAFLVIKGKRSNKNASTTIYR